MSHINRVLDLDHPLRRKSVFLFGPRQSGKSTYLETQLSQKPALSLSLLDSTLFREFSARPARLRERIEALDLRDRVVVVDEIQKCPSLLDEIHHLIESRGIRFLLTGSSSRKLKSTGVNLLGGRALRRELHPLTYWELGSAFDLDRAFAAGLLPSMYGSDDPNDDLQGYVGQYLREEIAAEGLTRNLAGFSAFLDVAATCNTQQINFSSIGSDVGLSRVTIHSYFQILVDTLLGEFLEPARIARKRKVVATPKFFFFDPGVVRNLRRLRLVQEGTSEFGEFFEHVIFHHLRCFVSYKNRDGVINFWRTTQGDEVDFILNNEVAIECKATTNPSEKHLKGLRALATERTMKKLILVCRCAHPLQMGDCIALPLTHFLDALWAGDIC